MQESISSISKYIKTKLKNLYPTREIDCFIFMIFADVCDFSSTKVLAFPEESIDSTDLDTINTIVKGLENQEPIQYLLGSADFYDLKFIVDANVLIPRQETEELVHWILSDNVNSEKNVLDIGTGSGAIAISLAKNRSMWTINALDISEGALNVASENAKNNDVKLNLFETNILKERKVFGNDVFDIVVSNPPYVCEREKELMEANVLENEPHLALFVENTDPLLFYNKIAILAYNQLSKGGLLYFEINEKFGKETCALLEDVGFSNTELRKDLNGKDRMVKAWR